MKYAISNIAWQSTEDEQIYKLMDKYNFTGLEIAPGKFFNPPYDALPLHINNKRNELLSIGISVISMQALLFGSQGLTLFESRKSRTSLLDYMKKAVVFAANIGAQNLVFGAPKNRIIPDNMPAKDAEDIAIDFFSELGEFAKDNNTVIGMEANAKEYGGNFINTTTEAIDLIKKVNSDGFQLNLDLSTITMNNTPYEPILKEALQFTNHIHISEPFLNHVPQGNTNHIEFSNLLKKMKYRGFISIEMKSTSESDNYDHVESSMKFIQNIY